MQTVKENIFLDSNIIINEFLYKNGDALLRKLFKDSTVTHEAIRWLESQNHNLFVASFSIVQLVSQFQGKKAKIKFPVSKIQTGIRHILSKYHIVALDESDIRVCADEINCIEKIDIEDNLIRRLSDKAKCVHIMTLDKHDFNIHISKIILRPQKVRQL
jgi:predicted nucleic-acid-binding protein